MTAGETTPGDAGSDLRSPVLGAESVDVLIIHINVIVVIVIFINVVVAIIIIAA